MKRIPLAILALVLSTASSLAAEHKSLALESKGGIKGWTVATAEHSRGGWMNSTLVVVDKSKVERKFHASRAFIEKWGFSDSDTTVVVRSRHAHGPSWIEKFEVSTGKLIAECEGSNFLKDTPEWAQPWCDEAKPPAEQVAPSDGDKPSN